jgi:hypothetical protein
LNECRAQTDAFSASLGFSQALAIMTTSVVLVVKPSSTRSVTSFLKRMVLRQQRLDLA